MYRKRLKLKSGCMRCKLRKTKCDEHRPKCTYCQRWNLSCVWPQRQEPVHKRIQNHHQVEFGAASFMPGASARLLPDINKDRLATKALGASTLDPFHNLPVPDQEQNPVIMGYLHDFVRGMIAEALPLPLPNTQLDLARGCVQFMFADAAVYHVMVAYSASVRPESLPTSLESRIALQSETRGLNLVRQRLLAADELTEGTMLAAALHFVSFTLCNRSTAKIDAIFKGIEAMVHIRGGYVRLSPSLSLSTIFTLETCDMLQSFRLAREPSFWRPTRPRSVASLAQLYADEKCHDQLSCRYGPILIAAMCDMKQILFFRKPSTQTRDLSPAEASFLHQLLQYVNSQLAILQARTLGTRSPAEVFVLAAIIIKLEVIVENVQHEFLVPVILDRLRHALEVVPQVDHFDQDVSMWACLVTLIGCGFERKRTWFLDRLHNTLRLCYGSSHLECTQKDDLRERLARLPWHQRLEQRLDELCV